MWFVYMVRCNDNSLYTGVTNDVTRRVSDHNSPKNGAKYTRAKQPVTLVFTKRFSTKSQALMHEARIKKLPKKDKERLLLPT